MSGAPTIWRLEAAVRRRHWVPIVILNQYGAWFPWSLRDHILKHDWGTAPGTVIRTEVTDVGEGRCLAISDRYTVAGKTYYGSGEFMLWNSQRKWEVYSSEDDAALRHTLDAISHCMVT